VASGSGPGTRAVCELPHGERARRSNRCERVAEGRAPRSPIEADAAAGEGQARAQHPGEPAAARETFPVQTSQYARSGQARQALTRLAHECTPAPAFSRTHAPLSRAGPPLNAASRLRQAENSGPPRVSRLFN